MRPKEFAKEIINLKRRKDKYNDRVSEVICEKLLEDNGKLA